jgi:hypothetical protein
MKRIILLVLICVLMNGYTQTTPGIAHYLGVAKQMMNTTDDQKPLVMLNGIPYTGSIAKFKASDIESIKVMDQMTAHALFQGSGIHGAIVIATKQYVIDACRYKLLNLGEGFRRFVRDHKGNDNISYRLNGHMLTGDKYSIANELYKIPDDNIRWVKTAELPDSTNVGAIVSVRTLDSHSGGD